ncbi:MAG: nucleotide exchange factor GrpE, partial [Planctomycetaceae bacterium]
MTHKKQHEDEESPHATPQPVSGEQESAGDVGQTLTADDINALLQALHKLQSERDEYFDRSMRAQAEFDNYRKRQQKEAEQERLYAPLPLVRLLLPGMDNLQRALDAAKNTGETGQTIQGVELVLKEFQAALEKIGVKPIAAIGEHFDPNLHEAIQQLPSPDHEPWQIIQELERGYTMHDRVVRPSRVIVSSGPPAY